MRCFLALDLPDDVRRGLDAAAEPLRKLGNVRWVPGPAMHITLKFLGELQPRQVAEMRALVERGPWPSLSLQWSGFGQFPLRGVPRVVWAGLAGDLDRVAAMAGRCEAAASLIAVPAEERPFRAHVTLGRCKSPLGASLLSKALREQGTRLPSTPFRPAAITLYQSDLAAPGSVYNVVVRRPLQGNS